jgi:hypothetical protein
MASQVKPTAIKPKPQKRLKKPRKGLRRVSEKKEVWNEKYHKAVKERVAWMKEKNNGVTFCERCLIDTPNVEPHHPKGQIGEKIMFFRMIGNNFSRCRCHNWIHNENPNKARQEGWLT